MEKVPKKCCDCSLSHCCSRGVDFAVPFLFFFPFLIFSRHKTRSNTFVRGVVGRRNRSFFDRMTSKRRRNSYSDYERRGSLQRRSIHAQNDPVVLSPADLPVQSTLPSRPLKVSS